MVISISNNLYIHACDNIFIIFQNYIECLFKFNRKISYSYIMYFHLIINIIIKIYFFLLLCFYKEICDAKIFYYIHAYTQNVCAYACVYIYVLYIHKFYVYKPKKCLASSHDCLLSIHFTHLWVVVVVCLCVQQNIILYDIPDGCFFFSTVPFIYGFYI